MSVWIVWYVEPGRRELLQSVHRTKEGAEAMKAKLQSPLHEFSGKYIVLCELIQD